MKEIKAAYRATLSWLTGIWLGQYVDWERSYNQWLTFYMIFDEYD